jgi:hypothetical protein
MQPEFWVFDADKWNKLKDENNGCQFSLKKLPSTYKDYLIKEDESEAKRGLIRFSQPKVLYHPFSSDKLAPIYRGHLIEEDESQVQVKKIDGRGLIKQLSEQIGITCLTSDDTLIPSNALMWSHYAESHRGSVIEFNPSSEFLEDAAPVQYSKTRPIIDARLLTEIKIIPLSDLYFKSEVWEYENETRIAKHLTSCEKLDKTDALGNQIYVHSIPPEAVKCIYIGCNASDEIRNLAIMLNEKNKTKVIFLRPHDEEYRLIPYASFGLPFWDIMSINQRIYSNRKTR